MDRKVMEAIDQRNIEIERLTALLNSRSLTPKELKKTEKEIAKLEKLNKKSEFWGGVSNTLETKGAQLQQTGKAMQKAGLKTTAIVWTPAIYLGYKAVKSVKGKSPESDLVTLVKECEEAHAAGKITEEQMKQYITDFVENYYRK